MWTDGQRIDPSEVPAPMRAGYPHYVAHLTEREEPHKGRVMITIELTGPNGEHISGAKLYASRPFEGMPQMESDWVK